MARYGLVFLSFCGLALIGGVPGLAQSVISTHSGLVYFFDGSVFIGPQRLEQKFGKFPDIGEGGELRTEHGRAEVLLTPGVFLRVAENSTVRMVSTKLSDTRVELLDGSAIVEADEAAGTVKVIHKDWQVRVPKEGVYRINAEPAQVVVYKGHAEVSTDGAAKPIDVREGETLPLAAVLVPDRASPEAGDEFKSWAMTRSQAISSDNQTSAGIIDDPDLMDNSTNSLGGFSYFPVTGIPGVAGGNPYGLSFWSPFQSTLNSIYFPSYSYRWLYPTGWPSTIRYPLWSPLQTVITHPPTGGGAHTVLTAPRLPYSPPVRAPHAGAPPPHITPAPHARGHR
jgi:hypothetical protein